MDTNGRNYWVAEWRRLVKNKLGALDNWWVRSKIRPYGDLVGEAVVQNLLRFLRARRAKT